MNDEAVYGRVYLVTNTVNGKGYAGQTKQTIHKRLKGHKQDARNHEYGSRFMNAINKYGPDVFTIEELRVAYSQDELDRLEIFEIAARHLTDPTVGYNIREGGSGGPLTPETRKKISKALKGRKFSPEHCKKISEHRTGTHWSAETRAVQLATRKNTVRKPNTLQQIEALIEYNKTRIFSAESRKKTSDSLKRYAAENPRGPVSSETRRKISRVHKGKHKPYLSAANRNRVWTPESRQKLADSMKRYQERKRADLLDA